MEEMNSANITAGEAQKKQFSTTDNKSYRHHDVFISYSSKNKNVADAIVSDFEQHGIKFLF